MKNQDGGRRNSETRGGPATSKVLSASGYSVVTSQLFSFSVGFVTPILSYPRLPPFTRTRAQTQGLKLAPNSPCHPSTHPPLLNHRRSFSRPLCLSVLLVLLLSKSFSGSLVGGLAAWLEGRQGVHVNVLHYPPEQTPPRVTPSSLKHPTLHSLAFYVSIPSCERIV